MAHTANVLTKLLRQVSKLVYHTMARNTFLTSGAMSDTGD